MKKKKKMKKMKNEKKYIFLKDQVQMDRFKIKRALMGSRSQIEF